jgi:elongator complex protein 3
MYYPPNFPAEKESFLIGLFKYLLEKNPQSSVEVRKFMRKFLKSEKEKDFFPSFWMLNLIYWRHFSKNLEFPEFMVHLIKNKVRSQSGIVPLSLFTTPQDSCPFNCVYCATSKNAPKSYFADEAAVRRAIRNDYDPYKQTLSRLIQFFLSGHPIDKIEVIIQGGTFSFLSQGYREEFVTQIFAALNEDVKELIVEGKLKSGSRLGGMTLGDKLNYEKKKNETATSRCVGLTIETRPDFISEEEIVFLRKLGVTRVEIGVQSVNDDILKIINRGHSTTAVISASKLLKEAGFKVTYHLMPGLPGSSLKMDLESLKEVFTNPNYLPDAIKLYPTQLVKESGLQKLYAEGKFKPMSEQALLDLTLEFKRDIVPPWVRILRNVRDLTEDDQQVVSFPSNFRQNLFKYLDEKEVACHCIRCREVKNNKIIGDPDKFQFSIINYQSSDGEEYFIQCVDEGAQLLGFVRLRLPEYLLKNKEFFIKELTGCALIRELHVYGKQLELGAAGKVQHLGIGKKLMLMAEEIAIKNEAKKIAVISGIGVREYYKKMGYGLDGEYMVKDLDN